MAPSQRLAHLLHQASLGDEHAFSQFYDAVAPRLYGLVRCIVPDPAQAEEVTQEAFLKIWKTAARFDPSRGNALTWAVTIAHRAAVDRMKAAGAATRLDHHGNPDTTHETAATHTLPDRPTDPSVRETESSGSG